MRDITFNGDDVILGTHGRGIWILDDAAPLRQSTSAVAQGAAHLFAPAVAYRTRAGSDQGTPLQPDETAMPNPATGALIDYFVGNASGTLQLQILDASGNVVRAWASTDPVVRPDYKALDIPAYWFAPQPPPSAQPGAHRWIWDLHYAGTGPRRRRGGGGPIAPPGRYTVRMTIGGRTYNQPLIVRRDPTYPATDADLRAQFELALAIERESDVVSAAGRRGATLLKAHPALRAVIGTPPGSTPDDSVGMPAQDFNSLRYIGDALQNLQGAVESADARPTADMYASFAHLKAKAARAIGRINASR